MSKAIVDEIKQVVVLLSSHDADIAFLTSEILKHPIEVYDAVLKEKVLVQVYAIFVCGDNPMLGEFASQSSLIANHPCRVCWYGGPWASKRQSEEFFKAFDVCHASAPTHPI